MKIDDLDNIGPLPPFPLKFEDVNNVPVIDDNHNGTKTDDKYHGLTHDLELNKAALKALYDVHDLEINDPQITKLRLITNNEDHGDGELDEEEDNIDFISLFTSSKIGSVKIPNGPNSLYVPFKGYIPYNQYNNTFNMIKKKKKNKEQKLEKMPIK